MRPTTTTTSIRSNVMNQAKTTSITENSPYAYLERAEGIVISKSNTCNGVGAQTDNLFTVTGCVKILEIWGVCTEATSVVTLSANSLALYDGAATAEITDSAAPTDLSAAFSVGDVLVKNGASATVSLACLHNATGVVNDTIATPTYLLKKTAQTTYIQHLFTGDAATDADITWYVKYVAVTSDGVVTAV